MHETYGDGVKFGPPDIDVVRLPQIIFLKGIIIAHKIKISS